MRGHTSRVWDVDSNQKGDRVLSASGDRTVKVWDWEKKEESERLVTTLSGNTGDVYAARWHPMGVSTSPPSGEACSQARPGDITR